MHNTGRFRLNSRYASSLVLLALAAGTLQASLCVWRSPDKDIAELFKADGYKTVFEDIGDTRRARIEARLGAPLDADETQFKFFPVFKAAEQVGMVMTHVGKGQFGAIEVVVAVVETDSGPRIKAVRIQRDREKAKAALRSSEFLDQFKGKGTGDAFTVGLDLATAAPGAEKASQAVATAARKLVIVYYEFYGEEGLRIQGASGSSEGPGTSPSPRFHSSPSFSSLQASFTSSLPR